MRTIVSIIINIFLGNINDIFRISDFACGLNMEQLIPMHKGSGIDIFRDLTRNIDERMVKIFQYSVFATTFDSNEVN